MPLFRQLSEQRRRLSRFQSQEPRVSDDQSALEGSTLGGGLTFTEPADRNNEVLPSLVEQVLDQRAEQASVVPQSLAAPDVLTELNNLFQPFPDAQISSLVDFLTPFASDQSSSGGILPAVGPSTGATGDPSSPGSAGGSPGGQFSPNDPRRGTEFSVPFTQGVDEVVRTNGRDLSGADISRLLAEGGASVDGPALRQAYDAYGSAWGLTPNGIWRAPEDRYTDGRDPNSYHLVGAAIDIGSRADFDRLGRQEAQNRMYAFALWAQQFVGPDAPFEKVLFGNNTAHYDHVHIDLNPSWRGPWPTPPGS